MLIALTATLAACGGGDSSDNPRTTVEGATLQGIESGIVNLEGEITLEGATERHFAFVFSGPFRSTAGSELPELDLSATVKGEVDGEPRNFRGGLTLLGNEAYIAYKGTEYKVDPTTLDIVGSMLKEKIGVGAGGEASEVSACREAASELPLESFIEHLKVEPGVEANGVRTTHASGDLSVSGVLDALIQVSEDPACREQLDAAAAPSAAELDAARSTVAKAIKSATIEMQVGDDHIVRGIVIQAPSIVLPKAGGEDVERIGFELKVTFTEVNEDHPIDAPKGSKPLNDLFLELGVNPIGIGGLFEGIEKELLQ